MIRRPLRLYELESLMRTDEILSLHWTDIESLVHMLDETIGKLTMVRHNLSIALTLPTTKHKEEL